MPLAAGARLGPYEVVSALGAGGMGEVYRARDSKLGRDVAIKIVTDGYGEDPERLARLQREAQTLAALNHPHIGAIYGFEEANGSQFLVLELVEGDTLPDRLKRGALPVEEALRIATQIAEASEAAHERGIVHRDLKPANGKVTPDGQVKVLDFGLAKAFDEIDAEFALTEGGGATIDESGRVTAVNISTTEKVPREIRLVVNGTSGHASIPRTDNALVHLSAAVAKLGTWEAPMRLNETTRAYFEQLAAISAPDRAARYRALLDPARAPGVQRYLAENEPQRYTMLRTSVVPTILKAGFRVNVIPSEAEATIDIRALPDEEMPKFYEELRRIIDDPTVKVVPETEHLRPAGPPSRLDTEMFRALDQVSHEMYPGAAVLPTMLGAATDMAYLRPKGVQSYGIGSASTDEDTLKYGAHSDVERLAESSLYGLVEFTWRAVMNVAAAR